MIVDAVAIKACQIREATRRSRPRMFAVETGGLGSHRGRNVMEDTGRIRPIA